jgi:RNA polymerase sigma-70 factor (ECF subfamily)
MMSVSEIATLVGEALGGHEPAFTVLVEAHLGAAYLTALAVVGRPSDAEDVVQTGFVRALEQLHTCRDRERFSGWLLRIVRNHALDWLRQRRRRDPVGLDVDERSASSGSHDLTLRLDLLQALQGLTSRQREVVLLHDVEGWSHAEISDSLEISQVMSRQHLFVARRLLRGLLSASEETEENHGT